MTLEKVFILAIISTLLQGKIVDDKKSAKITNTLLNSIWRRFDCHTDNDCPKSKYCLGWKCVSRHKGYCSNDSECKIQEWCNIQHNCVQKSWCDEDTDCKVHECCAEIDPFAQGRCLPLIKPGQLCLTETVLCPCVNDHHCKPFSRRLGRCTKNQDIKI